MNVFCAPVAVVLARHTGGIQINLSDLLDCRAYRFIADSRDTETDRV